MNTEITPQATPPKRLDQVRDKIRVEHYSIRTKTQRRLQGQVLY